MGRIRHKTMRENENEFIVLFPGLVVVVVFREISRSGDFVFHDKWLGIAKISFWLPSVFCCGISLPPN